MTDGIGKDKREFFRLKFQAKERPVIRIFTAGSDDSEPDDSSSYEVIDISERGLRFNYTGGVIENPVKGSVAIRDYDPVEFNGTIVRIFDGEICLTMEECIPLRLLVQEQRYLYKKYGSVIEGDEF